MQGDNKHFESRAGWVPLWRIRATELHDAARLVWCEGTTTLHAGSSVELIRELYRPAQLLMGLCLEVALKALIVERDPTVVKGGKITGLKTHSLERLFGKVNLSLMDGEEELNFVRKLSDAVEWVAKYPVPLNASQLKNPRHQSENTLHRNDRDFARFEALWQRIDGEFENT